MASKGSRKPKAALDRAPSKASPAAPGAVNVRPAASQAMLLTLLDAARLVPGCGFGIGQSMVLGSIDVKLPEHFDMTAIEPFLREFAFAPLEDLPLATGPGPEGRLVSRIHLWHAAIQRGANLPVFGNCRLWDRGVQDSGARRIGFAVPCHNRPPTMAAMRFLCEAISALAAPDANAQKVLAELEKPFEAMWQILMRHSLAGTNTIRFIDAAYRRDIPRYPLFDRVWVFGHGVHRKVFNSSLTSSESHLGVGFARDKLTAGLLLRLAGLPVAVGARAENADQAAKLAGEIGYPVVVKPANRDQGEGVTAGIEDEADLRRGFEAAAKLSDQVMVEKHHYGQDYRVTVLHGRAIKLMVRRAAGVVGDGQRTIAQLVDAQNEDVREVRARLLKRRQPLAIDEDAQAILGPLGYDAETVLPAGEYVPLRRKGNVSAGGSFEVWPIEKLHPDNRMLAESAALTLGLELAGIDIISGDPEKSWRETGGIICEVNASPQIGYTGSEEIYGDILVATLKGDGRIPIHLLVLQEGVEAPANLPELARAAKCNAAAWDVNGWVDGAGQLGPFSDAFRASKGILFNPRVRGALIAMSEPELLRCGLPAEQFASIRLIGNKDWKPSPMLRAIIHGHSQQIVRSTLASQEGPTA